MSNNNFKKTVFFSAISSLSRRGFQGKFILTHAMYIALVDCHEVCGDCMC